jgi:S1-C subfamily serine protease
VLIAAAVGQLLFAWGGQLLRGQITWAPARALDAVLGSLVSVVSLLLVSWFFASALRPGPVPVISRQISDSTIVTAVDQVMPDAGRTLFSSFRQVLDNNSLPPVFGGLEPERIREVAPPSGAAARTPALRRAVRSVLEVRGTATRCDRRQVGSGFVISPQHVITNAHVVAGVRRAELTVGGVGPRYPGRVVAYDPDRDLAVLYVPALRAAPLPLRGGADRGDEAVVAGFPGGGPLLLGPARIRDTITARGPDIYHSRQVERQVFSLYADVEPGNSGGPLLSPRGDVYGVVFAKSLDDPDTGYALTAREAAPVVEKGRTATKSVSTGSCA